MNVHEVLQDAMERGWFTEEQKNLYGAEMSLALLGEAAGFPLVCGPEEIFEEVSGVAGLRRNVKAFYQLRFRNALHAHRQEVEELALEEVA